ncbi:hypothetical protein A5819_000941 [Enterococcus sp. 7E2_DIV0204]|uniref:Eco57I restriction-modification methylase domain-containing protein n=2 Tax=unclassified Enterococcus TaxID=2608891 RepID=UPI000A32BEA3|nr:hypothetical protein [Enterococcus sp. 7E2_DIV0204]OTN88460.1 hypothetical protein A5819_000941 [Enterococcus sp. 7E2_DIV0204]
MSNEWYEEITRQIEKIIEKELNETRKGSWRDIVTLKNRLIFEIIDLIIFYIRRSLSLEWEVSGSSNDFLLDMGVIENRINSMTEINLSNVDISIIYQYLLADDIHWDGTKYSFTINKHQRDNLGSYYTPSFLSDSLTEKAVNSYLRKNFKLSLFHKKDVNLLMKKLIDVKVADLSVGAGTFLVSYIKIIKKYITTDKQILLKFAKNIYGIDVDPTALKISEHMVSMELGEDSPKLHLLLGNPLLPNCMSVDDKKTLAFENRVYNRSMSLDMSFIPKGGFDLVIGNPPWEKVRFEERTFFKSFYPIISSLSNKKERAEEIEKIKYNNECDYQYYSDVKSDYEIAKLEIKNNYSLKYSTKGELNTYNLFYELAYNLLNSTGVVGLLVKSSMVKTPSNKNLFSFLTENNYLSSVDIFSNTKKIFAIDSREEFAFVISSQVKSEKFLLKSGISDIKDFKSSEDILVLNKKIIAQINPTNKMLPNFANISEANFIIKMYKKLRSFSEVFSDVSFGRLVHLTNHSEYIKKECTDALPIYEGKFIERYNPSFATFDGVLEEDRYKPKASAVVQVKDGEIPEARFFINTDFWEKISKHYREQYTIMWRSLTSTTNRRTMLATVMPFVPTAQSIQFLQAMNDKETIIILGLFNSIIFDYFVRMKMPGIDLTQAVIKDIPVPEVSSFDDTIVFNGVEASIYEHLYSRISWLYRNDKRMDNLFSTEVYLYTGNDSKRCNAEIDLILAKLYDLKTKELKKVAGYFKSYYSDEELELFF